MKKALLIAMCAMLFSCNNKPDFSKIKVGMKLAEVVDIVGEPKEKQDNQLFGKWYVYDTHLIVFTNDTVASCQTMDEVKKNLQGINEGIEDLGKSIEKLKE